MRARSRKHATTRRADLCAALQGGGNVLRARRGRRALSLS